MKLNICVYKCELLPLALPQPINANLHFRMYICCCNQIYIDIYKHYCIVVDTIITFCEWNKANAK